ncbi:hypothetical protein CNY67_15180 [Desulfovibrio sp. G11]|nr:hypothetical protein CNY67_15180 [Desulfovibrio sp. G11]
MGPSWDGSRGKAACGQKAKKTGQRFPQPASEKHTETGAPLRAPTRARMGETGTAATSTYYTRT